MHGPNAQRLTNITPENRTSNPCIRHRSGIGDIYVDISTNYIIVNNLYSNNYNITLTSYRRYYAH